MIRNALLLNDYKLKQPRHKICFYVPTIQYNGHQKLLRYQIIHIFKKKSIQYILFMFGMI